MDITFRQLEIFCSVVVAGSFTKASHRIGLSQPSISQQLARLETTLNTQLLLRDRSGLVSMTPAGEYWYNVSGEMLERVEVIMNEHDQRFRNSNVVLRLGATPVLRGRFTTAAARIAQAEQSFVKFELVYDLNSAGLVEQLRMHRINFAIVDQAFLNAEASGFATAKLFDDTVVWAVPALVPDEDIRYALSPGAEPERIHPVLRHYVEIDPSVPTRAASDDWFRTHLPHARATFRAPTFAASAEFAAGGLASCHLLMSLLPNLSRATLSNLKLFGIDGMQRTVVLAMRRQLLTHAAYARIFHRITEFCQTEYAPEMGQENLRSLTEMQGLAPLRSDPVPFARTDRPRNRA